MFYPWRDKKRLRLESCPQSLQPDEVTAIDEVLDQPIAGSLVVVGQSALRVASAALKSNSTPWLGDIWGSRNFSFFRHGEDLMTSLQTLHFGTELFHSGSEQLGPLMDIESQGSLPGTMEEAYFKHGVANMTLHSLGVVLLAIGSRARVDPNNVQAVRRLASQACTMGPRYQELTQRIQDCDFGYGKDLKKPKLQEAVYEKVVLELQAMGTSLRISRE